VPEKGHIEKTKQAKVAAEAAAIVWF